jgi:uncharacterized protein YukE
MTAEQYSNELEQTFNSLPGWVQSPLRPIYQKMDEWLKLAAGNPDDLVNAGQAYVQLGTQVQKLSQQQQTDRAKMAGRWRGDAYEAFSTKMQEIEGKVGKLGEATGKTDEVLKAGAEACVEGANMIVDIIVMVLSIILAELAINLALSVITFGASLLAEVAEFIATALAGLARILQVVEKIAMVLEKVAQVFQKIAMVFREIKGVLEAIKELLAVLKDLKKGAKGLEKLGWFAAHAGGKTVVSKGIQYGSGGNVVIPGAGGEGYKAGKDYKNAWDAADAAQDAGK